MIRPLIGAGLALWLGLVLILSGSRRFSRVSLAERLRPFHAAASAPERGTALLSVQALREVVGPLARSLGDRLAAAAGVSEQLDLRLRRVHSSLDVTGFRTRQLAWAGGGLVGGLLVAGVSPVPVGVLFVVGAPLLAFLVIEQQLAGRSERWQRTVAQELPVVAEQLAMLLNAGWSLGAAIGRLAERGRGCCATDLGTVVNRVRQGVALDTALKEWAEVVRVEGVDRLVAVLDLNRQTSELGRLVGAEARQARRDLQRRTVELIERRSQQVWVPVTVATLVPGVILLAVPFLSALRLFSNA
jgi:Flp pilus assembly protein TadB